MPSPRSHGGDITQLILDDHDEMRRRFAALDEPGLGPDRLSELWAPLAHLLEVHADAEEAVFYPRLLAQGSDGEDETEDAISDHNKIRDGVRAAASCEAGSTSWWEAVGHARKENSEHMAEEERGPLPDFRAHTALSERQTLGEDFVTAKSADPGGAAGLADKDPEAYIRDHTGD
jgi:hypothetical protein